MNRLELNPETQIAGSNSFAIGLGFHTLVDALKRRPRNQALHPIDREVLAEIVMKATNEIDGLKQAGEYRDPASANSGITPTWAL